MGAGAGSPRAGMGRNCRLPSGRGDESDVNYMEKKKDLRQSLAAKAAAILLLIVTATGAVVGTTAVTLLSCGYGAANTFQDDILCKEAMSGAMDSALSYVAAEQDEYGFNIHYNQTMMERAGGFAAQVFLGDPANGNLLGGWSDVPAENDVLCRQAMTVDVRDDEGRRTGEYYTVVGYVSKDLPAGSNFAVRYSIYNQLHNMPFSLTILITVALAVCALAALVFLFCAAGHKAGHEEICLNWQDRVPLDLYACLAVGAFSIAMIPVFGGGDGGGMPFALQIGTICLSAIGGSCVLLAAMLTLATRLKKGKWWRNTVCWQAVRWCKRLWRRCWQAFVELVRILPMTWRVILGLLAVLGAQSILTLLVFDSYEGFFFFLVAIGLDTALAGAAAWMTVQLQKVRDMGAALAAGDLEAQLDTEKMYFDVKRHAEDLNAIGVGMNKAVEQRLKSERLKTELITNVSHDIKTPLTSIVNYVDLLKKQDLPPDAQEYLMVLDRQSRRLKKLTEDLVEASKASTGNVTVNLEPIVVNEIIHQAIADYEEKLAAGKLEMIVNTYEGNLMALADGRLLWRVLDNLLGNVCKYAMAGTRVYVDLSAQDGRVFLSMKNISRDPLNVSAEELMERFVRGDASRHTEGSGLGLNIARSFMDLMGGGFELYVDGDLFKAELSLRA